MISEDTDAIQCSSRGTSACRERAETGQTIENSEVLKKTSSKNKVQIGSEVKVKVKGKVVTYIIVSDVEADPLKNKNL